MIRQVINLLRGGSSEPPEVGEAERLLAALQGEADAYLAQHGLWYAPGTTQPVELPTSAAVLAAEPRTQAAFVAVCVAWTVDSGSGADWTAVWKRGALLEPLLQRLYRRQLEYSAGEVTRIVQGLVAGCDRPWYFLGRRGLLRSIQRWAGEQELPPEVRDALLQLRQRLQGRATNADERGDLRLVEELLGIEQPPAGAVDVRDDWGAAATALLATMADDERAAWNTVLAFAASATGSKPSKAWLERARRVVEGYGAARFSGTAAEWLRLLERPTRGTTYVREDGIAFPTAYVTDRNADLLKGLAWCATVAADAALTRAVGDAAVASFRKLPQIGARATRAGNACVWALSVMPGIEPVAQLQRVGQRVKQPSARATVEKALNAAAERAGMTRDDLEDLAVPTLGLEDGRLMRQVGRYTAEIVVTGSVDAELRWIAPDGRQRVSVPAEVKRDHAGELKELQTSVKALRSLLPAQRSRLERFYLRDRRWSLHDWRARFVEHELLGQLSRRLIWQLRDGSHAAAGIWRAGDLVGNDDRPIDWLTEATEVRLWHPIDAAPEEVLAWRGWLERHELTQPFKQAHREVYLLTDAERATETYSNRFAAHILRQHQLNALCRERGWTYRLQGAFDGHNVPELALSRWGLRAEFWVDGGDQHDDGLSEAGIYLHVASDQVRFLPTQGHDAVALADVPPLVFSEVMRDVDLFVGVCSVGNDPTWFDGGPQQQNLLRDYWWAHAFGDLSASAVTRRQVLERLLPKLAIADRCRLEGRFLVVRGDLRTYRIHLGSGNILMEPNDQYLCIVPGGRNADPAGGEVFLPFEGDRVLSVILSKALLLADDRSISDPTIARQIANAR